MTFIETYAVIVTVLAVAQAVYNICRWIDAHYAFEQLAQAVRLSVDNGDGTYRTEWITTDPRLR